MLSVIYNQDKHEKNISFDQNGTYNDNPGFQQRIKCDLETLLPIQLTDFKYFMKSYFLKKSIIYCLIFLLPSLICSSHFILVLNNLFSGWTSSPLSTMIIKVS